jgi:hypothetical protein
MTLLIGLGIAAALGYVLVFPIVRRGLADLSRIPGPVWRMTGYRNRKVWRNAMVLGYLCGGFPAALVVLAWRRSEERVVLRDEWHLLIEERRARHEIVLADYEEQSDQAETKS